MTDQEINEAVARKLGYIECKCCTPKEWLTLEYSHCLLPDYCHDIKAAWEIAEKHKGDMSITKQNGKFCCEIYIPSYQWNAWADTAPMAICLAFIKLS